MSIEEIGYFSNIPVQADTGSVIRVVGTYKLLGIAGNRNQTKQLRTEWEIVKWSNTVMLNQLHDALTETLIKKLFCKVQSEQVSWTTLTTSIPYGGTWNTFRIPLSNILGSLSDPGENKLVVELTAEARPKSRYTFHISGVPKNILARRKAKNEPEASTLKWLELALISPVRIPIYLSEVTSTDNVIDFVLDEPNYIGIDQFNTSEYNDIVSEFFQGKNLDEKIEIQEPISIKEVNNKIVGPQKKEDIVLSQEKNVDDFLQKPQLTETLVILRFVRIVTENLKSTKKTRNTSETAIVKRTRIRRPASLPIRFQMASANVVEPLSNTRYLV